MKKTIYVIHSVEIEFDETQISEKEAVGEITGNMYFPCEDTENVAILEQNTLDDTQEACKAILCEEPEAKAEFSERFQRMSDGDYSEATQFEEYLVTAWAIADGGTKAAMQKAMPEVFYNQE